LLAYCILLVIFRSLNTIDGNTVSEGGI